MNSDRAGIWKETDAWVDRILDYCIEKIKEDICNKTLQWETAIGAMEEMQRPDPSEDYYRGFDDGLKNALVIIEFIKEGEI
jgi:hypothetical protein